MTAKKPPTKKPTTTKRKTATQATPPLCPTGFECIDAATGTISQAPPVPVEDCQPAPSAEPDQRAPEILVEVTPIEPAPLEEAVFVGIDPSASDEPAPVPTPPPTLPLDALIEDILAAGWMPTITVRPCQAGYMAAGRLKGQGRALDFAITARTHDEAVNAARRFFGQVQRGRR